VGKKTMCHTINRIEISVAWMYFFFNNQKLLIKIHTACFHTFLIYPPGFISAAKIHLANIARDILLEKCNFIFFATMATATLTGETMSSTNTNKGNWVNLCSRMNELDATRWVSA
jgi:hypothetical protein